MVIRPVVMGIAALMLGGCSLFESPCNRVANAICTIPGEAASCQGLRAVKVENQLAQKTCESLEPAAKAYAQAPDSALQKTRWLAARVQLGAAGLVGAAFVETPQDKLKVAGEKAKEAAEKAGEAAQATGDAISEAARNAGAIIKEVVEDSKDSTK